MKILAPILAASFLAVPVRAEDAPDSKALAFGYAAAFACLNKASVQVQYLNAGQPETIKDVNEITAFGGVLLVKTYRGRQVLDAGHVIKISDNN